MQVMGARIHGGKETAGEDISSNTADHAREKKHGIRRAAFCPAAAALLVLGFSIPKLIDGVIDQHGEFLHLFKSEMIKLSPDMPAMNTKNFVWACIGNIDAQRNIFKLMIRNNESIKLSDWLLCNSSRQHCISPLLTLGTTNLKTRCFKFK
ncbi:hypothetical protein V6N13_123693 [Hibiscus sabdariffa]